jgi:P27 family predicted phage terminase small subunit
MVSRIKQAPTEAKAASEAFPEPPDWLTDEARARYFAVAAQLQAAGTLSQTDAGSLVRYATTWSRWVAAERAMAESGEAVHYVRLTDRRGLPASSVATPSQMAASKAHDQLLALERELGLTPRARGLAKTPTAPPADDPGEAFFRETLGERN